MRFTVASKIWLGCILILFLGAVPMLVVYRGLLQVRREMRHLAEVKEPVKSATHEMEINVKGIAIGTLGYLSAPTAAFRELVENNQADFEEFHARYLSLSTTQEEREFGEAIRRLYDRFKARGQELRARRDRQAEALADGLAKLEEMDRLFDQQLPAALDPRRAEDLAKLESVSAVDEGIDAIRMRFAIYRWSRDEGHKALIVKKVEECRAAFGRLKAFSWEAEGHGQEITAAEGVFERAMRRVQEVLAHEDQIQPGIAGFIDLREEIDALLDDRMQPLAVDLLLGPRQQADAATASAIIQIGWLVPLFVVTAALASLMLTRTVTRPLKSLARGTELVSRGDLAYRAPIVSRDEFAILAQDFNRMVSRLEETLVSREALARSEQELQRTVQALQQEISERVRAEEEQARLQASLRRAQMLSAMGTLVAGVAHQVRNPLFGISSILDAMEARLGQREEYRPYLDGIRGPAGRLNTLMHELMEYGRSWSAEHAPGSIAGAVQEAIRTCGELAERAQVRIECSLEEGLPDALLMDRPRLCRAFENVLENAVQHSPPGGVVTVAAREVAGEDGKGWVEVRVEDRGPGFKKEDLPLVFEPFFTRRQGGTGLGLALVERIVQGHGGQVAAQNRPGGGAMVAVRLPVMRPAATIPDRVTAEGQV